MRKMTTLILLIACVLTLAACVPAVPDIEPDISNAAKVQIIRSQDGAVNQITIEDAETLADLCDKIHAIKREYTDVPGRGTRYLFGWFDASGNSMGYFEMYRGSGDQPPMFSMSGVAHGGAHITDNSFDFDWLDGLFDAS